MNKYKVGDEVMIIGKIRQTDDDDQLPYLVSIGEHGYWVREHDIAGLASDFERVKPEPRYKVGDKVINTVNPEWGVGTVVESYLTYCVLDYPFVRHRGMLAIDHLTPAGIP